MKYILTFGHLRGNEEDHVTFEKFITNVEFQYDSPNDVTRKAQNSTMTIVVEGKLNADNDIDTQRLVNDWIKLESQETGAYCLVRLDVIGEDSRYVRRYEFPDAFVVDYKEMFDAKDGDGKFELYIRQKGDMLERVNIDGGFFD